MNEALPPDAIVGTVFVSLSLSCQRRIDQMQGKEPKIYHFIMSADHRGSAGLVNSLPEEMERLMNDAVRQVQRWEYRAKKAREDAAKVHQRPGTQAPVAEVLPKGQIHRRPGT
jgi:hypothetical protein